MTRSTHDPGTSPRSADRASAQGRLEQFEDRTMDAEDDLAVRRQASTVRQLVGVFYVRLLPISLCGRRPHTRDGTVLFIRSTRQATDHVLLLNDDAIVEKCARGEVIGNYERGKLYDFSTASATQARRAVSCGRRRRRTRSCWHP